MLKRTRSFYQILPGALDAFMAPMSSEGRNWWVVFGAGNSPPGPAAGVHRNTTPASLAET